MQLQINPRESSQRKTQVFNVLGLEIYQFVSTM